MPLELAANLDSMTPAELREYSRVMHDLSQYARYKAIAIDERKAGNIQAALTFENGCQYVYDTLPQWAKSW